MSKIIKITHIINPVKVGTSSDLFVAQPITFASMLESKKFASEKMDIDLISIQFEEDRGIIPPFFEKAKNLDRSIMDIAQFAKPRKLPLIQDIIKTAIAAKPNADFYIYSNVDIGLMPHFYVAILKLIRHGKDAIAINRKTIRDDLTTIDDLPLIYSEIGKPHEGIDCFVFSSEIARKMHFRNAFVGSGPVGMAFVINMLSLGKQFIWLQNPDLTFHIGDNKAWSGRSLNDYVRYNSQEVSKICDFFLNKDSSQDKNLNLLIRLLQEQFKAYIKAEPRTYSVHALLSLYCSNQLAFDKNYKKVRNPSFLKKSIISFIRNLWAK